MINHKKMNSEQLIFPMINHFSFI